MQMLFGGFISVILLGMYAHLVRVAVKVVYCMAETGCTTYPATYFNEGMAQALSVIGGLVWRCQLHMLTWASNHNELA